MPERNSVCAESVLALRSFRHWLFERVAVRLYTNNSQMHRVRCRTSSNPCGNTESTETTTKNQMLTRCRINQQHSQTHIARTACRYARRAASLPRCVGRHVVRSYMRLFSVACLRLSPISGPSMSAEWYRASDDWTFCLVGIVRSVCWNGSTSIYF